MEDAPGAVRAQRQHVPDMPAVQEEADHGAVAALNRKGSAQHAAERNRATKALIEGRQGAIETEKNMANGQEGIPLG